MGAVSGGDCGASPVVLLFDYSCIAYYSLLFAMILDVSSCLSPFLDCDSAGSFVTLYIRYVLRVVTCHWLSARGLLRPHSIVPSSFNYAMISTFIQILTYAYIQLTPALTFFKGPEDLGSGGCA